MEKLLVSTLPARQPMRDCIFAIRLTEAERDQIEALAQRLKLPDSFMALHFILEAVAHHSVEHFEDIQVEGRKTGTR